MAAEGRNLLEVVLKTDIATKFNEVDNSVSKLQSTLDSATESANKFAAALKSAAESFGDASGTSSFIESIQKLIETLNGLNTNTGAKGIEQTKKGIESIGEAAILDIDSVQKLIDAINKLPEAFSKANGGTSGHSGGSKKKALDNLLFSRDDIEEKKRELESELERLSSAMMKIKSRINEVSKPKIDEIKFGIESQANKEIEAIRVKMQQLWQDMSVAMQKSGENSKDALVPYLQTVEKLRGEISEIQKNAATMKDMVSARDVTYQSVIELLKQYDAVLAKIHQVAEERRNLIQEQNSTAAQSKQDSEYKKRIDGIISSIKELQKQYDELKKKNRVFDNEGNMTLEAERIANQISAQKELLKIEQMSAEEAVKYTEDKVNAQIKKEQEAFSEIKRLYSEMLGYEKKQAEIEIKGTSKEIQGRDFGEETKLAEIYQKEIDRTRKSIEELEAKYPKLAEEAKKAYDTERIKAQIASSEKLDNAIDKTIKSTEALAEAERKRKDAEREKNIGLAGGDAPRTIREYELAIKNLRREIKNLYVDTQKSKIEEYNIKISDYERKIQEATGATSKFVQESIKLNNVLQQVAGAFGVYLGVQGLVNFARNVATTTGYFEMQHRALQAIIQDTYKANELWDKTVRLAVKSPYKIKDLVTYTKQLSAYRIETDKLYDTTKMLADISSGLGVDMNRLILAYGQVKAANYLRGQELRQFSEAGVNILGELANYFSELQGRAISTGDVFEMVSKRMVKFEDVATVLHRLTEEGGIFFNMQEQQAETIQGQLMNLKDTFDLFMNSVGEKGKGVILDTIKGIRNALEDSEKVLMSMGIALGAVALRFTVIQAAAIRTKILSGEWVSMFGKNLTVIIGKMVAQHLQSKIHHADMEKSIILGKRLAAVEKEIATARAAGATPFAGWATIFTAVAVAAGLLYQKIKSAKEEQKKLNEEINRINAESAATTTKSIAQFKELANKIRDVNTSEAERNRLMQKMKQLYGEILPERLRNIDYITKEGNAYDDAIESIKNYYLALRREKEIEATINQSEQAIEDSIEDVANNIQKNIKKVDKLDVPIYNIKTALRKLRDEWDAGKVTLENYQERLTQLLQISTGVPITMESLRKSLGMNSYESENVYVNLAEPFVNAIDDANKKLKEVTGRTEDFGMEMKKALQADVFDKAIKIMNEQLDNEVAAGLMGNSFKEALEYRAEYAEYFFRRRFENFKNEDYYKSLSDVQKKAIEDQFETMLGVGDANGQLAKQMATQSAETIADALYGFVKKHNLNKDQIGIVQQYLIGSEDANKEYLENSIKSLENYLNDVRNIENGIYNIPLMLSAQMYDEEVKKKENLIGMKDALTDILEYYKKLNAEQKKSGGSGNPALQLLNKQIDAIKNAAKQYDEYKKRYEDTKAFNKTKEAVGDLFKELGISNALKDAKDWKEDSFADNVEKWLNGQMLKAGKDGKIAVEKYVSTISEGFDEKKFKNSLDVFKKQMEEAISDYNMFSELNKLGIGKDFASLLFGVNTNDLKQLRDALDKYKMDNLKEYLGGTETTTAIEEMDKKISDIEDKEQKERLKKYVAYTKQAMTERARIEVEGLQEIYEIEKTFQKEIEKSQEGGNTERAEQIQQLLDAAVEGSKRATNEKLQKQAWEDFKGSDMYVEMFNDIGNASTKVIEAIQDKITQLRSSYKELKPTDLKAITLEITKLEDELIKRNPAKAYFDLFKQVKKLQSEGKDEDTLMQQMGANDAEIENLNDQIAGFERLIEKRKQFNQEQIDSEGKDNYLKMNMSLQAQVEEWKKLIEQKKKDNALTAEELATYKRFRNASKGFADYLQNIGGRVASIFSDIMSNLEAFGGETTNTSEAWGDLFSSIMSIIATIPNYILLMKAAAVAANEALGVVGWIITAVEVLVALIKGVANIRNAAIDDEIERYKKQVDDLSDKYDRLEKKFDSVWDINRLRQYNSDMRSYMEQQIGYYEKMIKAEESRKSPDQSVIDEYNRTIDDLYDQMEERHDEWLEKVSGFGGESSWGDATQGFIDAWYDAFAETGDGLEGLKENFNEVIVNMVKKQAALRLANAILEPLYKKINEAANDGTITNSEMDAIVAEANATFPELNEKLKAFFQSLGVFGEQAAGELDGLQKGIQGVTEQTAEIIAAYMNSIRYYVIDNNTKLGQIISALQDSTGTFNPMVAELRNIRQQAEDIRNLLFSWRETSGVPSMRVTIV